MRDEDLDALLRSAAPAPRTPGDEQRVFADVWARVQASMDDGTPADDVQSRRLDLIASGQMDGHVINSGDTIVFASVGAGMHINAAVYRVP